MIARFRRPLVVRVLVVLAVIGGLASLGSPLAFHGPDHVYEIDLVQDYVLARALADGIDPYQPITTLAGRYFGDVALPMIALDHPTPHPPTIGLLLLPFAGVDYPTVALGFFALKLVALFAALRLIGRVLSTRLSVRASLVLAVVLPIWPAFSEDLLFAQVGIVILCLLAGARLALLTGRLTLGGFLLGFSLLLKPLLWPLFILLVPRSRWRALAAGVATVGAGYLAVGSLMGIDRLLAYFTSVLPAISSEYCAFSLNISLWSVGWRLFSGTHATVQAWLAAPPLLDSPTSAAVAAIGFPTAVLAGCAVAALRLRDLDAALSLLVAFSVVASPIAWGHYLVLTVVPVAWVIGELARRRFPRRPTAWAVATGLALIPSIYEWSDLAFALVGSGRPTSAEVGVHFGLSLLTLMPLVGVLSLALLVHYLARAGAAAHEGPPYGRSRRTA